MKITICGSGRFKELIHDVCDDLTKEGFVVLKPPLHDMSFTKTLEPDQVLLAWKGATFAHLQRVAIGEVCVIVNPGGYMGTSSTLELGAAVAFRKLIIAFQHDPEPAREGMFHFVLETDDRREAIRKLIRILSASSVS